MTVDWEAQWAEFAAGYREGLAHIDVGQGKELLLRAGPGFGDLSHPTTQLMMKLLAGCVAEKVVLDIGCGSGILALAALLQGARFAYGIDIDDEALTHSRNNAQLNGLESRSRFSRTLPKEAKGIVLINMILSEQQEVLAALPDLPRRADVWIASGFLVSQKAAGLSFLDSLQLQVLEEAEEEEWIAWKCTPI